MRIIFYVTVVLLVVGWTQPSRADALDILARKAIHYRVLSYRTCSNLGCSVTKTSTNLEEVRLARNILFSRSLPDGSGLIFPLDAEANLLTDPLTRTLFEGTSAFTFKTGKGSIEGDTVILDEKYSVKVKGGGSPHRELTRIELSKTGCKAVRENTDQVGRDVVRSVSTMSCELIDLASDTQEKTTAGEIKFFNLVYSDGNRTTANLKQRGNGYSYYMRGCADGSRDELGILFPMNTGTSSNAVRCTDGSRNSLSYEASTERDADHIRFKAHGVIGGGANQIVTMDIIMRFSKDGKCIVEKFAAPYHSADAKSYCSIN